jgi:hypothetical protein
MTVHLVGTCGNCNGPVEVPQAWFGIYPPVPTCRSCGATPPNAFGPRIAMNPSPRRRFNCDEAASVDIATHTSTSSVTTTPTKKECWRVRS